MFIVFVLTGCLILRSASLSLKADVRSPYYHLDEPIEIDSGEGQVIFQIGDNH